MDKNIFVQKILRLLGSRLRNRAAHNKTSTLKISRFWSSLAKLKYISHVETLAVILFQSILSGHIRPRDLEFLVDIPEDHVNFILTLSQSEIEILNDWQFEFCGFVWPIFPISSEAVRASLGDLGLEVSEKIDTILGRAIYLFFNQYYTSYENFSELSSRLFREARIDAPKSIDYSSIYKAYIKFPNTKRAIFYLLQYATLRKSKIFGMKLS